MNTKSEITNLPSLTSEGGLSVYLAQIKKFPILDAKKSICWPKIGKSVVI